MSHDPKEPKIRQTVSSAFSLAQDVVYVALGIVLAATAAVMLVQGVTDLVRTATAGMDAAAIIAVLDRILLALMVVELLYTVQVSFRAHVLAPEPFLLVALIAGVRRILIITAELSAKEETADRVFQHVMWELGLTTLLVVVLVASLVILRRSGADRPAPRSHHE